jgi:hypothetical protein
MKFRPALFALPLVLLTVSFAVLCPAPAPAAGGAQRLYDPAMDMWSTGSRVLINQALANPAVRTAMRDFDARGYVRVPTYDCSRSSGDSSMVMIAYQQPGVDMSVSMPMIVVFNLPGGSGATVDVRGGIVERAPDGSMRAGTGANAHTVHVIGGGGLSTWSTPVPAESDPAQDAQWAMWVLCTFRLCTECESIAMPLIAQVVCCYLVAIGCHKVYVY